MKTAIFRKFIQLLLLALLLNTAILYIVTGSVILNNSRNDMVFILDTIDSAFHYEGDLEAQAERISQSANLNESRLTIIDPNGVVRVDTGVKDASELDNHMQREEFQEAVKTGEGDARRRSKTLGKEMLYVAIQSSYSDCILRLAVPYTGMQDYIKMLFPAVLLSFSVALIGSALEADRFSQSITKPLLEISKEMIKVNGDYTDFHFERCGYEEINIIANTTTRMSKNVRDYLNRLEQEKQIRQEFFSNASHELKTPITSIRGYVELLDTPMADNPQMRGDFLSRIKKEAVRMTSLIDDILMISRLETGGIQTELRELSAGELAREAVSSVEGMARERRIEIETDVEEFYICADGRQMEELFTNLLSNAVKYNLDGGKIWLSLKRKGRDMELQVRDNGVGIPKESVGRIFERFYRVDKGRSRKQGGTGLGLSIVKHVVNFYHGTVSVSSSQEEGTHGSIFTVRLPIAREAKQDSRV